LKRPLTRVAEKAGWPVLSMAEALGRMAAMALVAVKPDQVARVVLSVSSAMESSEPGYRICLLRIEGSSEGLSKSRNLK
jgi:hypothetical protein